MSAWSSALFEPGLDLIRRQRQLLESVWLRRPVQPAWFTDNQVILETDGFRLRLFGANAAAGAGPAPVLLVPPEVNTSNIVDFGEGQSLVRLLLDRGFARVAVIEWRSPGAPGADRDVADSIADIHQSLAALGGRAHLIGVCQGGWESAVAVALKPEAACSLTLVAAPIDFHAGAGLVQWMARSLPYSFYQTLVALGGGVMKGEFISLGFDNLMPFERHFLIPLAVWNHLDEDAWMARYDRLADWYRSPKDLPGPMYLTAVRRLFQGNELIQGRFSLDGRRVDLAHIDCPLVLVAGSKDHITPPAQVWAAEQAVSSAAVMRVEIPAGHVGTFMGRTALADHWPAIVDFIKNLPLADRAER